MPARCGRVLKAFLFFVGVTAWLFWSAGSVQHVSQLTDAVALREHLGTRPSCTEVMFRGSSRA